jgi:hypothetical protein
LSNALRKVRLAVWVNKKMDLLHHLLRKLIPEVEKDKGTSG